MGRSNRGSGADRGSPSRTSNLPLSSSQRGRRDRGALGCHGRTSRDTPPPLARPRSSGKGGTYPRKPLVTQHQVHPETPPPPSYPAPLKGGKKKRRKSQAAELPKKFPRGARPPGQGEQSQKGEISFVLCRIFSYRKVPTAPESNQHKSHKSCPLYRSYPYT